MRIQLAGLSDRGTTREKNDDHYCIGPFVEQETLTTVSVDLSSAFFRQHGVLAAVADGLGGYAGGALASRVTLETLSALYYGERREGYGCEELGACLQRYLEQTRQALAGVLARSPELANAGTTLAGIALMPPDLLVIFHVGDSRVLREAAGYVRALTIDHTPIGLDLAEGRISEVEAAELATATQLTRALGQVGDSSVDISLEHRWLPGNRFLIGTDGWHGTGRGLTRQEIQQVLRQGGTPENLTRQLVAQAVAGDGHDNATLVMVSIEDEEVPHG